MATHYFDADGVYGSADAGNLTIVKTTNWTPAMWETIADTSDSSRMGLAEHFEAGKHNFYVGSEGNLVCDYCELGVLQLPKELEPDIVY